MAMNRSIRRINNLNGEMENERRQQFQALTMKDLRTKTLRSHRSQGVDSPKKARKNLLEMTANIRNQVHSIETLSHYKESMTERALRARIQQLK
jgi:hypothetical protein